MAQKFYYKKLKLGLQKEEKRNIASRKQEHKCLMFQRNMKTVPCACGGRAIGCQSISTDN
jgi:hypothetical protein